MFPEHSAYEISMDDIRAFEKIHSQPNGWRDVERSATTRHWTLVPPAGFIFLHLAPYFRVDQGDSAEFEALWQASGLEIYDPTTIPDDLQEARFPYQYATADGSFTFLPKRPYLGHTIEEVSIPPNESWEMWPYFIDEITREEIWLKTNATAPLLHPGSCGPQTYELYNEYDYPLTVNVHQLACPVAIFTLRGPVMKHQDRSSNFGRQEKGKIKIGHPSLR